MIHISFAIGQMLQHYQNIVTRTGVYKVDDAAVCVPMHAFRMYPFNAFRCNMYVTVLCLKCKKKQKLC